MADNDKTYHYDLRGENKQKYLMLDKYLGLLIPSNKRRIIEESLALAGICGTVTVMFFINCGKGRGMTGTWIERMLSLILGTFFMVVALKQMVYVFAVFDMPDHDGCTERAQRADRIISEDGLDAVYREFMEAVSVPDTTLTVSKHYVFAKGEGMARTEDIEDCIIKTAEDGQTDIILTVRDENGEGNFKIKEIDKMLGHEERRAEFKRTKEEVLRAAGRL